MDFMMESSSRAHFSAFHLANGLIPPSSPMTSSSATASGSPILSPFSSSTLTPISISNDENRQPFFIGVSGGTTSGKTTVCDMIILFMTSRIIRDVQRTTGRC